MRHQNLAISWNIHKLEHQLISSNFSIQEIKTEVHLPLTLVKDLEYKIDLLHLLRTPHHIPQDPIELVKLIEKIQGVFSES